MSESANRAGVQSQTSATLVARLQRRRGDYGFDAPAVPVSFIVVGVALLVLAALFSWWIALPGVVFLLCAASYLYTTRAGKFYVWARLLARLGLRGDEHVLDLGCGRGAVLLMAARLLPEGKAVGVDLWQTRDQSGNALAATQRNAEREGVAGRVELFTADLRTLPFADASFDVVLSSLAIHNIHGPGEREKAIDEAMRVLKPGGRLLIADINATGAYAERLRQRGMSDIQRRGLGWRFWYGGPWVAAVALSARKPV